MARLSRKRRREIAEWFDTYIPNPVAEFGSGTIVYFQFNQKTGKMEYGDCGNVGFLACGEVEWDDTYPPEDNVQFLLESAREWAERG